MPRRLYHFSRSLDEDMKEEIRATTHSEWLQDLQENCAANRARYAITYDQDTEGLICGKVIDQAVPIAIYSGFITVCDDEEKCEELLGETVIDRDRLDRDDFSRYRILLTLSLIHISEPTRQP
jgi:hypothetical protein